MTLDKPLRDIAAAVAAGRISAVSLLDRALESIARNDQRINAVTRLIGERARRDALVIDGRVTTGQTVGPLAGIPFGVKDLFDVAGLANTAGAAMRSADAPAAMDAEAIRRLTAAGAVLVATLNMDAFAYGFATINAHHGTTRNPHDAGRLAGGSSGGSAAAVAAGYFPFSLGSDTNGSIRVPAALCGIYGLKPTHGGLPMAGVAPFVDSFDDIGPFAARLDDLRLVHEVLAGAALAHVPEPLRVARLGGWFTQICSFRMRSAIDRVAWTLSLPEVELPMASVAREAAYLMTASEGGALHLQDLRRRPLAFDPHVRDRLIAGAMLPISANREAERFRAWFRQQAAMLFERFDLLIAPATPCEAPLIDDPMIEIDGQSMPARSHLGFLTQPLSFIGLPVLAVPLAMRGSLPLGLQLIAAPGCEAKLFAFAQRLEAMGLAGVSLPVEFSEGIVTA